MGRVRSALPHHGGWERVIADMCVVKGKTKAPVEEEDEEEELRKLQAEMAM